MATLQEVVDEIVHQLDWRGPSGKVQGIITIPRAHAVVLVSEVCALQLRPEINHKEESNGQHVND